MQCWENLPCFLSQHLWQRLDDSSVNSTAALEELVKHAFKMGLRCPSELTQALFTAMVVLKQPEEKQRALQAGGPDLRSLFLNVKGRVHSLLSRMRGASLHPLPDDEYLSSLPADPAQASEALRRVAFPPDGQPVPSKWCLVDLQPLASKVPLRSTNKSASSNMGLESSCQTQMMAAQAMMMWNAAMHMAAGAQRKEVPVTLLPPRPTPLENLLSRAGSNTSLPESAPLALEDVHRPPPIADSGKALPDAAPCAPPALPATLDAKVELDPSNSKVPGDVCAQVPRESFKEVAAESFGQVQAASHAQPRQPAARLSFSF